MNMAFVFGFWCLLIQEEIIYLLMDGCRRILYFIVSIHEMYVRMYQGTISFEGVS